MTPTQKAKEIIIGFLGCHNPDDSFLVNFDRWLQTPSAAAMLSGEDWISVKDRLPELNQRVLVYSPDEDQESTTVDFRFKNQTKLGWSWDWCNKTDWKNPEGIPSVTHWQPLPEPPKP